VKQWVDGILRSSPALSGIPPQLAYFLAMLLWSVVILAWVLLVVLFLVWLERKVSGRIQSRYGPIDTGGKYGWAQTPSDALKLLLKEDLIPQDADRLLFNLSPIIVFVGSFLTLAVIPFGRDLTVSNLNIGIFYILAVASLGVVGIMMGGWASNNKWSLYGAMRAASQIVSYEIPVALSLIGVIMFTGSLNMNEIAASQAGGFWHWNLFRSPFLFAAGIVYFVASLAEINRTPFDLPEAESELVSGYHTEYSGMKFAFFFLAEFANMFVVAAIASVTFLGAWNGIIPLKVPGGPIPGMVIFLAKCFSLILVMMWLRWTLPRLRVDQLMHLCWKVLIPVSFLLLIGLGTQMLVFHQMATP
jgi:NADH-quinone oxidoreductase subunit H